MNTIIVPETFKVSNLIKSPKKYKVEDLIKFIGYNIFNLDNLSILIKYDDKLLNRFSTSDIKLQSLLYKTIIPHNYIIYIRTSIDDKLENILCHEMQHLNQYEKGDIVKNDSYFIWKNEKYDLNTPYENRPWEKEARQAQYDLWKQFKKFYFN